MEGSYPDWETTAGPKVLYIEADGAWINSRERLPMEGKVGLVHQGPEFVGRNRLQLRSAVYVTTFEDSERLGEELYLEADCQGLEQADLVVLLGDGAKWIRELHQTHFPDALYILDWLHLRRELYRAQRGVAAELGADYETAQRMTLKDLLWFGQVEWAVQYLEKLRGRLSRPESRDAITAFKRYILDHRSTVAYVDLFEAGIHVGSGPIEKAADLVINRRCELRGMTWYRDSANDISNLRAIYLNGPQHWAEFWPT